MMIFLKHLSKLRRRRGSAIVEFSVLMLAFVPLILLPMYFQDSLRFQLDTQEAVCGTAWDFAFANYETGSASSISGSVASTAQARYKNLWSGNKRDKSDKAGPWCDFAWESQIACTVNKGFASEPYDTALVGLAIDYHDEYTKGGLVECKGNIAVENHYIPKQFGQEFEEKELFPQGTDPLSLPEEKLGILVDPWTIHNASDATQGGDDACSAADNCNNQPFYERTEFLWKKPLTYQIFRAMWWVFVLKMMSKISLTGAIWDDPSVLKMASHHPNGTSANGMMRSVDVSGGRSQFYTNPYGDDDPVKDFKETFENRDVFYMGCTSFGPDCN